MPHVAIWRSTMIALEARQGLPWITAVRDVGWSQALSLNVGAVNHDRVAVEHVHTAV